MRYVLEFAPHERAELIGALITDFFLAGDGRVVFGKTLSADGQHDLGIKPALVPPPDQPNSRWYDPGPKFPEQEAPVRELLRPEVEEELTRAVDALVQQMQEYLDKEVPLAVTIEQTGKRQAKVVARDDEAIGAWEAHIRHGAKFPPTR